MSDAAAAAPKKKGGMKKLILMAVGGLFYWFIPASVAVPLLTRRAHGLGFEGLSGTLWSGRADRVLLADGRDLGTATWQLGREAILGRTVLDMHLEGRAGRFDGHMEKRAADRMTLKDVAFRLDAAALAGMGPTDDLVPSGIVEGRVPQAELQGNWPMTLEASIVWKKAAQTFAAGRDDLVSREALSTQRQQLWLDHTRCGAPDLESRLSRLTAWVLMAERMGLDYGLRIPGRELAPDQGPTHRARCLEAMALC